MLRMLIYGRVIHKFLRVLRIGRLKTIRSHHKFRNVILIFDCYERCLIKINTITIRTLPSNNKNLFTIIFLNYSLIKTK